MDEKQLAEQYDGLLAAYNKVTAQLGTPSDDRDARALVATFARIARISLQDAHLFVRDQARKSLEAESERFSRSYPIDGMSRPAPLPVELPLETKRSGMREGLALIAQTARHRIMRVARRLREGRKIRPNEREILEIVIKSLDPKPTTREQALRIIATIETEAQVDLLVDSVELLMHDPGEGGR